MDRTKIAITGMGVVSAAGAGLRETLDTFESGRRNVGPVSLFPFSLDYPVFEIKDSSFESKHDGERTLKLASHALKEALREAGLEDGVRGMRVGVCLGTTVANQFNDLDFYREYRKSRFVMMEPVERYVNGNLAEVVMASLEAQGPCYTVANACSSGTDALGMAVSLLKSGMCDIAVAGGADELNKIPLCGFGALSVVSNAPCAPFDRAREGLNLGEGSGVMILETEAHALERGVKPELFISGYGSACDAYHLTAPRPDGSGLENAVMRALSEAGIGPGDVGFINAHGTATRDNDKVEGSVIGRIFGSGMKFLSTKGYTGHTLGAAGGLEAIFTAVALKEGWIPESAGFVEKDEEIPAAPVTEKTEINKNFAVSNSLAFGGNNAVVVLERRRA